MKFAVVMTSIVAMSVAVPAMAGQVKERTTYFMVRGSTFDELEHAMGMQGPQLRSGGERHAGSTEVSFDGNATYRTVNGRCAVDRASYRLSLHQTLPRWNAPKGADARTKVLWKTFRDDVVTHENQHSAIAKSALKRIEDTVRELPPMADCAQMETKVNAAVRSIIQRHDRDQLAFDRSESRAIDARLARELRRNLASADR
jgi:predicted secreted Zn-dependent protease